MDDKFKKIIDLARKTGDKVFIYDSSGLEETVVLMGLDEYEKILQNSDSIKDLTESELLDRINCDIALWRSENSVNDDLADTENKELKKDKQKKIWSIPAEVKAAIDSAKITEDDNNDDDDDRQYLEDIKEL